MKNHIFIAFIALLLACSMLAGCSGSSSQIVSLDPTLASTDSQEPGNNDPSGDAEQTSKFIDPFEVAELSLWGLSGSGALQFGVNMAGTAYVITPTGRLSINLIADEPENNGSLRNGDLVHVRLDEIDYYVREYLAENGLELSRTEADLPVRGLNAYGDPTAKEGEKAVVNLKEYISVSVYGNEGYSELVHIQAHFDEKGFLLMHQTSLNESVDPEDTLGYEKVSYAAYALCREYPIFEIISTSHAYTTGKTYTTIWGDIYNGEVIHLSLVPNEENIQKLQKLMNVTFVFEDISHTVTALKPTPTFDPVDAVEVVYTGKNGEATATAYINTRYDPARPDKVRLQQVEVISDNNGQLSNGDVIILDIEPVLDLILINTETAPTTLEVRVVVTGLE